MRKVISRNLFLYCPLTYMYVTRLGSATAVIGYVLSEFVPFALTANLCYTVPVWKLALAFAGFLSLYELTYVRNDEVETAKEASRERLDGAFPPLWLFAAPRIVLGLIVAAVLWHELGAIRGGRFLVLSGFIVLLGSVHTWAGLQPIPWIRIITFAAMAAYKYAAWVVPFISLRDTALLLMAGFLFYGLPRTGVYAARKLGSDAIAKSSGPQDTIRFGTLLVFAPLLFMANRRDLDVLWCSYAGVLALTVSVARIRRSSMLQSRRAHD